MLALSGIMLGAALGGCGAADSSPGGGDASGGSASGGASTPSPAGTGGAFVGTGGTGTPGSGGASSVGSGGVGAPPPGTGGAPAMGAAGRGVGAGAAPGLGGAGTPGGGGGRGGRAGTGGPGAGAGGGGGPGGAAAGGPTTGGPSLCAAGKFMICEDFESTAVGAVPAGWTMHGSATVAMDQAARGTHALKIGATASGERRIYTDVTKLGSGHWGRVFYRVQLPVPGVFVHSTIVGLQGVGPTRGNEEVRVVDTVKDATGKHQFLYNVQPSGAEFGKGSAYNWMFDGAWHCAEWHIDNPTQSYHFYYDGVEVTQIAITNGAGNYTGSDIPPVFSQVHLGWNNYQSAPPGFVAWVDEFAMDTNRIGCTN